MFVNESIDQFNFPFVLKISSISLVFKKGYKGSKDNYHPFSILPIISRIFGKLLCKQITLFRELFLSRYQCGFRKGFSAQHWNVRGMEKICCKVFGVF